MISIVGIPFDESSSFLPGCRLAPAAIREAFRSPSSNTFAEDETQLDDHPLIKDDGDMRLDGNAGAAREVIESTISLLLEHERRSLALGGDHSITYPILRAYAAKFGKLNVMQLDAHPDLYDELDGDRFSHACPFARALEDGLIARLVQVGIRTMNAHQREQVTRFGTEVIPMNEWSADTHIKFNGPVYLSLDLDVLDPAFAPGISHYEPGGMSTRQVIDLIQSLNAPLIGADIVELNPTRDVQQMTAMVAAKLMKEILAAMLRCE